MSEIPSNAEIIFGVQLDSMLERHDHLLRFPHTQNGIGQMDENLKGHERSLVKVLGKAVVERIHLLDDLGHGGLAREIVEARRATHGTP